ncbi:MAG: zinc ribbon domain-containing protein [Thermoplasmata archaeon]|nr:zinc ribbon domain-containing protein [Thermoplasmata archaeon]
MFCPRCGTTLPDGARFCFSCGAQLPGGVSQAAAPGGPSGYPGGMGGASPPPPPPAAAPTAPKELKCPSCGAPLSPGMGDAVLTCDYCGATVSIGGTGWKPVAQHSMLMPKLLNQNEALQIVQASMDAGWFHGHRFEDSQVVEAKFVFAPYWIVPSAGTTRFTYQQSLAPPMGGSPAAAVGTMAASAFLGNMLSRGGGNAFVPVVQSNQTLQDQITGNYQFPVVAVKGYDQYQPKSYQFNLQARQPFKKENVPGGATVLNGDVGIAEAQQAARSYVAEMQAETARKKHFNVSGVQSQVDVGEPELLHAPVWYFNLNHKGKPAVLLVDANASRVMLQNL